VLDGLGLLDRELAKREMAELPEVRAFARKTVESLTKEYKLAATKALGHAEFLDYVRNTAGFSLQDGCGARGGAVSLQSLRLTRRL
jgi:hypothetical protein